MDILRSLMTFQVLYQLTNLSHWTLDRKNLTLRQSRFLLAYSMIVILGASAFILYGLFSDEFNKTNTSEVGQTVEIIQIVGMRLTHFVNILEAILRRGVEGKIYARVQEIDRIFERSLNVVVDNGKFRRKSIKHGLIIFATYLFSELFIMVSKLTAGDEYFTLFWFFYLMPLFVCGLRYFQISATIMIIKYRFDKLIAVLGMVNLVDGVTKTTLASPATINVFESSLPEFETAAELAKKRNNRESPELRRLLIIRDIYNRLWELTAAVNRCFGVSMLVNVGNDFVTMTTNFYWIFLNFKDSSSSSIDMLQLIGSILWSLSHFYNVLALALICEHTVQSTTGIALGLHHIQIDTFNDNHNTVIEQFSLQLLHQKLSFTAAGFFHINCTLLYTIAGATTTYLIILIQFHMNEQKPVTSN